MDKDQVSWILALTLVPGVGPIQARNLVAHCGSPAAVFDASLKDLQRVPGLRKGLAREIKEFRFKEILEKELAFMAMKRIEPISFWDPRYPQRLRNCPDAPVLLYYRGNADLNARRILGVVGTRHATPYGKQMTEELLAGLAEYDVVVVSGLAYGIDIAAHRAALECGLPTIGVVAHGLDRIYPAVHADTARRMMEQGGILTEFLPGNDPDRQNFPKRNRIVAGMIDALIVVETAENGGAVITASLANGYNRDVFAVPGDVTRKYSSGCNRLIRRNMAVLAERAADIIHTMNWELPEKGLRKKTQRQLFIELNAEEKLVADSLKDNGQLTLDQLSALTGLKPGTLAGTLLSLEFQGLVRVLPGKVYKFG